DQYLYDHYLRRLKYEKRAVFVWQIITLIGFFALWEIASRLFWIDPLLFSSPSQIMKLLVDRFIEGTMVTHVQVTLFETVIGFFFASTLWFSTRLSHIMDPYLVIMNAMPKVALGPIIIVALGPGYISIITMGAIISVIITTIVVYSAFIEVDPNYEKVLKSF